MDMRLSVIMPHFPLWIHAGWKRVADDPKLMKKAWEQCSLLEAWDQNFQNTACNIFEDGKLFPTKNPWGYIADGLDAEPAAGGDAVTQMATLWLQSAPTKAGQRVPATSPSRLTQLIPVTALPCLPQTVLMQLDQPSVMLHLPQKHLQRRCGAGGSKTSSRLVRMEQQQQQSGAEAGLEVQAEAGAELPIPARLSV